MNSGLRKNAALSALVAACIALASCNQASDSTGADLSEADQNEATAEKAGDPTPVETPVTKYVNDRQALFDFLNKGEYKAFPVHDERHASTGPHTDVVVYYNQVVADSIRAGNAEHPAGSMIVKEQYKPGEFNLYGWSVSIKTHEAGNAGKGWYWIEFLDKNDIANTYPKAPGNGVPECAACHTLGKDLVRSALPQ